MLFHYGGLVSEEIQTILKEDATTITLDTDYEEEKCFRFDRKTGACLNDNTFGGARRTLKLT